MVETYSMLCQTSHTQTESMSYFSANLEPMDLLIVYHLTMFLEYR